MNIKNILKQPINRVPVSAQFIHTKKVEPKPNIKPLSGPQNYNEKDREVVERWLSFCAIGTSMLDVGTKALSNMNVIHKRDAVFDLVTAFKQLRKHFSGNENFDQTENEMNDFLVSTEVKP